MVRVRLIIPLIKREIKMIRKSIMYRCTLTHLTQPFLSICMTPYPTLFEYMHELEHNEEFERENDTVADVVVPHTSSDVMACTSPLYSPTYQHHNHQHPANLLLIFLSHTSQAMDCPLILIGQILHPEGCCILLSMPNIFFTSY